ncbi:MAG: 2-oxo acid dehydrogenase subunit E2 [Deltaproteobacteria bacterium HGW-Deltaproteobacteria-14]|jgi:pyruvate dehydrogenase E2 component (dihydrolipoamide acetyltransferase)|nr:MAG: 2-oxo acid dehydrogenase subunit E2 [Deltaproteobacteria bacterium HGW-Deltaproteobacteria-14]
MRLDFKLPDLAEGMIEGEIVAWLVKPGDVVRAEQPIVEVMTDKATVVIPSPHDGTISELAYAAGDIALVGTSLWIMEVAADVEVTQVATTSVQDGAPSSAEEPAPVEVRGASLGAGAGSVAAAAPAPRVARIPRGAGKAIATPGTRRLARELGVDIAEIVGSGKGGRVTKEDVQAHARDAELGPAADVVAPTTHAMSHGPSHPAAAAATPAPAAARPATPAYSYAPRDATGGDETEERVKLRGLRRAIYETMARSTSTAAHFTYVDEVDCENLVTARGRLKAAAEARGVRMTYLPFIAKATLLALRRFPKMNASMDDAAQEVVLKRYFHLGIAAATPPGLVVPVIKHADQLTLLDLAGHIQGLGERARDGRLRPDELKGSTFTITSLGKLGGLMATPVINHPEVAILGVHQMQKRAVVRGDAIVARTMMNLSLSFDHRVIDGHEGAAFAQEIKRYLEDPELMMLEMA